MVGWKVWPRVPESGGPESTFHEDGISTVKVVRQKKGSSNIHIT